MYDWHDLEDDLLTLIGGGLVAVTGIHPELRFCITPQGQVTLKELENQQAAVRAEARELARARRAAAQDGTVLPLFKDGA